MDAKEFEKFNKELKAPPGKLVSTGVADLMAVMSAFGSQ